MPIASTAPDELPRPVHVEPVRLSALAGVLDGVEISAAPASSSDTLAPQASLGDTLPPQASLGDTLAPQASLGDTLAPQASLGDLEVRGITANTALVRPGDLFAALPGRSTHGARFAGEAVAAGAVAVLTDRAGRGYVPAGVPVLTVGDVRAQLGAIASRVYGEPSRALRIAAVTGTSGKTTTTFFLRDALAAAGRVPAVIGTVATMIGTMEIKTGFTTPEAPEVHALLAVMRERGVTDVAMEVSSHALELGRVGGVMIDVGGFTNLSQDHLDFHPSMEAYFAAKAKLFDDPAVWPVIVVDDDWGRRLGSAVGRGTTVSTRTDDADWWATDVRAGAAGGSDFGVHGPGVDAAAATLIPGRFNVANAVLAIAMLDHLGVSAQVSAAAIARANVPGRMERVDAGQPFLAVVDYSHKPAAVEVALAALRPLTRNRLIIVLGCGGDRDAGKRAHMGEIAARGADLLVVTDDNPRSEPPAAIRRAMLAGALAVPDPQRGEVREIGDRAEAIGYAVAAAQEGDTVLVAGKGHELGQEVAGVVHPFDDREVLRAALEQR